MADFLSRLVERSMGRAAVARPVLAPLFATGPELSPDPTAEREAAAIEPAIALPRPTAAAGPASAARPAVAERVPSAARVDAPREEAPLRVSVLPAPAMHAEGSRPNLTQTVAPPNSPGAIEVEAPERSPAVGIMRPARVDGFLRPRPTVAALPTRRPGAPEPANSPPVVKITIGRIDVHPTPRPAHVPAPPQPARKDDRLPLDDYLRRRPPPR